MTRPSRRACGLALLALCLVAGCGRSTVETRYGRSRWKSVNGTDVLADLFRARGHEVRTAVRMTDELRDWADVIVRFAGAPGPPAREEADWYDVWLAAIPGRALVYVPYDYDATQEYWARALEQLPKGATERTRERVEQARKDAGGWERRLPIPSPNPASPERWFAVNDRSLPVVCETLDGPWSSGLSPSKVALTRHQTLKVEAERVLLSGDDKPLVIDWNLPGRGRVLVVSNGAFLLNLPLTEPARWPLAERTVDWAASEGEGEDSLFTRPGPRRVAFLEGRNVAGAAVGPPSVFALLKVAPFGLVAAQLFALGLAACLARAPRLGRPRPDEPSGADRPVAHPEALGALLARTRQAREARSIVEAYRRWRGGPAGRGPAPPA